MRRLLLSLAGFSLVATIEEERAAPADTGRTMVWERRRSATPAMITTNPRIPAGPGWRHAISGPRLSQAPIQSTARNASCIATP